VETKETKELFAIYIKIAEEIAAELKTVITIQEKQLIAKLPTADLAAYDAYLKGQVYWRKLTQNDLQTAMSYFELAKKIDPDYALAYAGICDGWMGLQQMGIVSPAEAVPKAEGAIMKALELDSTRAEVKYSLALIKTWGKWDWQGGESAFKKAIAVNPNFSEALAYYSHLLNILGRPEEAIRQIETALSLDPINPLIKSLYGMDLLFERRYDDAILAFQDALNIDPTQRVAKNNLPTTLHLVGRDIEALEAYKSSTNNSEIVEAYKVGYTKGGFAGAIRQVADLLEELSKTTYIRQTDIADKYALCGDKDKAIKWLENGFQNHDPNLPYLLLPKYDSLRDDSRFQDLCRRMNLPYK
jgi:tetratricopeptide (TPR) repeat protein